MSITFSAGMDAQVAYGFHHLRNEKPYLAQGPISNKVGASCSLIIKFFEVLIKESLDLSFFSSCYSINLKKCLCLSNEEMWANSTYHKESIEDFLKKDLLERTTSCFQMVLLHFL